MFLTLSLLSQETVGRRGQHWPCSTQPPLSVPQFPLSVKGEEAAELQRN